MNNPSPLVPQGTLIEQKNQGRARVKIAVFFVLAIHGIGLVALLMQGCQKEKEPGGGSAQTNAALPVLEPTNVVTETPVAPVTPPSNYVTPPVIDTNKVEAPLAGATEYKVVKGDNFTTIAHHFKISVKALADANPGVDSAKLKVDQVLHIPAPAAAPIGNGTTAGGGATISADTANGDIYTVESGDNLTTIAKKKHTTVNALRAANNLKTDQLKVGQKLKIPKAAPAAPTTPAGSK